MGGENTKALQFGETVKDSGARIDMEICNLCCEEEGKDEKLFIELTKEVKKNWESNLPVQQDYYLL